MSDQLGNSQQSGAPVHLRTEHLIDPLGLGLEAPRFGWWVNGAEQTAYEIEVRGDAAVVWQSGKLGSDQCVDVEYGGAPLKPASAYRWRVRTWGVGDQVSEWSEEASFETGLTDSLWAESAWIGHPRDPDTGGVSVPAPYFRTEFAADEPVKRARLYMTARGDCELYLNGERVGNDAFAPGWMDYDKHYPAVAYDVTALVHHGANGFGAILGDGWFYGILATKELKHHYGDPALKLRLELEFESGEGAVIVTDGGWRVTTGPILKSDNYHGETYDARLEMPGWSAVGYDDGEWLPVRIRPDDGAEIIAKPFPPVRRTETLKPLSARLASNGETVYDFGQNMVGYVGLTVTGKRGETITLRYAEMLNPDDTLYVENLRSAEATDRYTFGEDGTVTWHPRFTFHGFRYFGISGADAAPAVEVVEGIVLHTDMEPTGSFTTSNAMVNQLVSNIRWGQRGNFLEVPTDCPQRDERLGWTGDAQVFVKTATFNYDVNAFFEKWMIDVRDGQAPDGQIPDFCPRITRDVSSPAWGDAVVIVPWTIYNQYGNTRIIRDNFEAMQGWMKYQETDAVDGIRSEEGYGDWLALDRTSPDDLMGKSEDIDSDTPKSLIGTAFYAYTASLLSQMAKIIGKDAESARYAAMFERVRAAFQSKFVAEDGRITGNTQTVYLLAVGFDLLPEALRPNAVEYLIADIQRRGWHLSTGFVGTGILLPVLHRVGRDDAAFKLLMQETYPGWFYSIHQGATTMWERWNSYTHANGFGPVSMNSFNHYAYGAVGEWMYSVIGGISAAAPAFKKIAIQPQPGADLIHADCRLDSPYGPISVNWRIEDGEFHLKTTIPANTTAEITLPNGESTSVGAGSYEYRIAWSQPQSISERGLALAG